MSPPAHRDHRRARGAADRPGAQDAAPGRSGGSKRELLADLRRVQGQGGNPVPAGRGGAGAPGRDRARRRCTRWSERRRCANWSAEAEANETAFRARVRTVLRSSYSAPLPPDAARRCSTRWSSGPTTPAYRPVDGRARPAAPLRRPPEPAPLLRRRPSGYPLDGVVPDGGGRGDRRERPGRTHPVRAVRAARAAGRAAPPGDLGSRAGRWRDPEDDLPADFELNRDIHYAALRQPLDPTEFIADLRTRADRRAARPGHAPSVAGHTAAG